MGVLDDAIREHLDLKRRRGADPAEIERAEREALGPVRRDAPAAPAGADVLVGAQSEPADFPHDDAEFAVEAAEPLADTPSPLAAETELSTTGFAAPGPAELEAPERVKDHLDPPTGAPLAAMPPEPEDRPRRRHLFGRRHHHEETPELAPLESELPAHDDPFAEPAAAAAPETPRETEPRETEPRETEPGESVSRARPIAEPPATPPALQFTAAPVEDDFFEEAPAPEAAPEPAGSGEDILEETPDFLADAPDHDRLWFEQKPPPDFDFDA